MPSPLDFQSSFDNLSIDDAPNSPQRSTSTASNQQAISNQSEPTPSRGFLFSGQYQLGNKPIFYDSDAIQFTHGTKPNFDIIINKTYAKNCVKPNVRVPGVRRRLNIDLDAFWTQDNRYNCHHCYFATENVDEMENHLIEYHEFHLLIIINKSEVDQPSGSHYQQNYLQWYNNYVLYNFLILLVQQIVFGQKHINYYFLT